MTILEIKYGVYLEDSSRVQTQPADLQQLVSKRMSGLETLLQGLLQDKQ
jgi:hypothetical protein